MPSFSLFEIQCFYLNPNFSQKLDLKILCGIKKAMTEEDLVVSPPGQEIEEGGPPRTRAPSRTDTLSDCRLLAAGMTKKSLVIKPNIEVVFHGGDENIGRIHFDTSSAKFVAIGKYHSAIVFYSGRVLMLTADFSPDKYYPVIPTAVSVACGYDFTIVVLEDGRAVGFGDNSSGQLGIGDVDRRVAFPSPVQLSVPIVSVSAIAFHCVYLLSDGRVATVGSNSYGQIGNGSASNKGCRVPVILDTLSNVVCVSAGFDYSAAVTADGRVATWGSVDEGALGHGDDELDQNVLVPRFIEGVNDAVAVSCGYIHTAILHADGTVSTFGLGSLRRGESGWLGHGDDIASKYRPQRIVGMRPVVEVACGKYHTIFLHANGDVSMCGLLGLEKRAVRTPEIVDNIYVN
jgi:alpha-tubulin suppressor-like RCC1 family protein